MKIKLLILFLALGGLSAQAQVNYAIFGNTAYVTSSPNTSGNVVITNIYDGYPVTSIGDLAFGYCYNLVSVTIPDSVTSIGEEAFYSCTSLTNAGIGNSVTSIGGSAFQSCSSLTSVTIPNSVTSIGGEAFFGSGLTNIAVAVDNPDYSSVNGVLFDKTQATLIEFPDGLGGSYAISNSVTSIGDYSFEGCSLTNVTIPNSVTNIEEYAFEGCGLANVTIPDSVTSIGQYAFVGCFLTSVTIPGSVTSIGDDAFNDCQSLTSATVGNGVTSIGVGAFDYDSSLTSVTIGNSVTSIGVEAFEHCSSLTSVTIPNSVTSIGEEAFVFCSGLTSAYFQGNAPPDNGTVFLETPATVYYLPGTTGWGSTFGSAPTAFWTLPYPLILNNNPGFGVQNHQFGFTVSWATNLSIVVEACTNLANPVWTPIATNALASGTNYFSDPQWTNYPSRLYRAANASTPTFPGFTGNLDVDMYNAALADGTANGGVPGVMLTENGGPFRVTAAGRYSDNICEIYSGRCVFAVTVGSSSCSSTTFPSSTPVIQFGTALECGFGPYGY